VANTRSGRMCLATAIALTLASSVAVAQRTSAATATPMSAAARSATYDAVLDGMSCRQHTSGRMDCEFRVGRGLQFAVNGVGQEDVVITFVQADTAGDYTASVVPLHGCVVVKPIPSASQPATADSVATFAFVSPKTGKVYRTWATCLTATRPDTRADTKADARTETKAEAKADAKAEAKTPPIVKRPR
jgi:hypothetical protein